ncbi:MAG: nucleotide exchange factor GrpE, partial [Candidatus Dormibacteraceae bacterium]
RYLRLAADFDNFKKRSRQERNDLLRYAGVELASLLLPVVDDFERVLEHAPEEAEDGWLKGVRMTVDKLREALATVGVKPIEVQGEHFDPQLHEAIATEVSEAVEEDTVLAEVRRGYQMHERILRPAMVRVSRKPNGTEKVASSDNAAAQEV